MSLKLDTVPLAADASLLVPNAPHILHVFSSFALGGAERRTLAVINALGQEFSHTITSTDGRQEAASQIAPGIRYRMTPQPPGKGSLFYFWKLRSMIRQVHPDLVITYNWGAIEATLAAQLSSICPVIHTEDGFGADEAHRLKRRRVAARRVILHGAYSTVVPSRTLYRIATGQYGLPASKVSFIPNGIDLRRFRPSQNTTLRARIGAGPGDVVFGYVGNLRPEKNLELLLRSFARADLSAGRLALVGDGGRRAPLEQLARDLGISNRVFFAGHVAEPSSYYGAFDVYVMSSSTEQMPMSLLEAMASGLPALSTNVGDTADLLGTEEPPAIVTPGNEDEYARALRALAENRALRLRLGEENRQRCELRYDLKRMVAEYRNLYLRALKLAPPG